MKTARQWHPGTDTYDVWLWEEGLDGRRHVLGPDLRTMTPVEPGHIMEPTLNVPKRTLDALAEALADHVTPKQATAHHLQDAIAVRDRLLVMLEQGHASRGAS